MIFRATFWTLTKPILILFFTLSLTAGTIEKHSGKVLENVTIHKVTGESVFYQLPDENAVISMSILIVKKITFDSGRVEEYELRDEIIFIESMDLARGLIELGDDRGYSLFYGVVAEQGKDSAVRDFVENAPKIGGNIIMVTESGAYWSGSRAKARIYTNHLSHQACQYLLSIKLAEDFKVGDITQRGVRRDVQIICHAKPKSDKYDKKIKYIRATFWAEHEGKEFKLEASKDGQEFWELTELSTSQASQ